MHTKTPYTTMHINAKRHGHFFSPIGQRAIFYSQWKCASGWLLALDKASLSPCNTYNIASSPRPIISFSISHIQKLIVGSPGLSLAQLLSLLLPFPLSIPTQLTPSTLILCSTSCQKVVTTSLMTRPPSFPSLFSRTRHSHT